jgi:hypothetical protein
VIERSLENEVLMSELAMDRFQVATEPAEKGGSFWHKLAFLHLNTVGDLAAESVAEWSGGAAPSTLLPAGRVVIRDSATGNEVWHVNSSDLTGGTTPEQLQNNIEYDLGVLSIEAFETKWGIAD